MFPLYSYIYAFVYHLRSEFIYSNLGSCLCTLKNIPFIEKYIYFIRISSAVRSLLKYYIINAEMGSYVKSLPDIIVIAVNNSCPVIFFKGRAVFMLSIFNLYLF